MAKSQTWFEVVQVVSRHSDGRISQWYPNDKLATLWEAKDEQRNNAEQFPGAEYQIIEMRLAEVGTPKVGEVVAGTAGKAGKKVAG